MKNKPKKPPQIAVKFANMVFLLGILFSILLIFYAIYKIYNPPSPVSPLFYIFTILCGGVLATLFGLGLKRLSNNLKVNLLVMFVTIGIVLYGFETYLEFWYCDPRSSMKVLDDLRDSGVEAYPNACPVLFLKSNGINTNNGVIYPLGTISNSTTTHTNEAGYHAIIETDEHGFNNPKGLYNKNKVDIVLTGDSFTEGYSVHSNESIGAVLRQLDYNAISVGKGGNGPLIELAALKEYAEPLKPKIILWVYFVNDLYNLVDEMRSSFLMKYLNEDDYSQNLISKQEEIDGVLINYVQSKRKKERNGLINILTLSRLRIMNNLTPTPYIYSCTPPHINFRDILQQSKQMVSEWGGKMYFVYLPAFAFASQALNTKTVIL